MYEPQAESNTFFKKKRAYIPETGSFVNTIAPTCDRRNMDTYTPGLHLLTTFAAPAKTLTDVAGCQTLFDRLINELGLAKVGETYHAFPAGGFTAVVCLTESHVSIHTWPEFGIATFDVFLSNFQRNNEAKVRAFYAQTLVHFEAIEQTCHELTR